MIHPKRGRPHSRTYAERRDVVHDYLRSRRPQEAYAASVGISSRTLRTWLTEYQQGTPELRSLTLPGSATGRPR